MIFFHFKFNNTLNKRHNLALRANFVTRYKNKPYFVRVTKKTAKLTNLWPLEFGVLAFVEGGKPENPEKNPRSRNENQQTQPTCDAGSGNRTRTTAVRGERSHHCAIPASPTLVFLAKVTHRRCACFLRINISRRNARETVLFFLKAQIFLSPINKNWFNYQIVTESSVNNTPINTQQYNWYNWGVFQREVLK